MKREKARNVTTLKRILDKNSKQHLVTKATNYKEDLK